MENNSILQKLDGLEARFEEVSTSEPFCETHQGI